MSPRANSTTTAAEEVAVNPAPESSAEAVEAETYEAAPEAVSPAALTGDELNKLKNKLRNDGERIVLKRYAPEVYTEQERLFKEAGIEFVRRQTPDEKKANDLRKLLAENPDLANLARELTASEGTNAVE